VDVSFEPGHGGGHRFAARGRARGRPGTSSAKF
jgi:hypothetical protein